MRSPPKFRGDPNRLTFEEMEALRSSIGTGNNFRAVQREAVSQTQTRIRIKAHTTLTRWQPVCIDSPLLLPDSTTHNVGFVLAPCFNTVAFAATKPWVICLEPIPSGKIGWAVVRGVTPALVFVANNSVPKCGAHITSNERLEIANGGPARIIWIRSGTGLQPAAVDLSPVAPRFITGQTVGAIASGATGSLSVSGVGTFTVRHLGTVGLLDNVLIGATWDDFRREYVVTMEFC